MKKKLKNLESKIDFLILSISRLEKLIENDSLHKLKVEASHTSNDPVKYTVDEFDEWGPYTT